MARFTVGDVVVVQFPFSDLKGMKRRPALVVALAEFGDFILCQITSKPYSSKVAVKLSRDELLGGALPLTSYIRPDKLFTADASIIKKRAGKLRTQMMQRVLRTMRKIFT